MTTPAPWRTDRLLPGLADALDGRAMAAYLCHAGVDACSVAAEVVRYRPEQRCTICYHVQTRSGPRDLFGKVFAEGAAQAAHSAAALAAASAANVRLPLMMPVVALVPELALVVFEACPDARPFHPAAVDDTSSADLRRAWWSALGSALAVLHSSDISGLAAHEPQRDLSELSALAVATRLHDDALAARIMAGQRRLASPLATAAECCISHGALRTDQVLLSAGRIALVDLDAACLADPARDLGNLIAYLDWRVLRGVSHAATVQRAIADLRAAYDGARGWVTEDRLDNWRAMSMLKIAGRRYLAGQTEEWPLAAQLVAEAERLIT